MSLTQASYSKLTVFEACKFHADLSYNQRIPEPERPLPPGKTEHANDRGTRIHEGAERFVQGGVELIPELKKFDKEFLKARELFAAGKASTEGDWAFTRNWEPVAWMSNDVWVRIKCDLVVHLNEEEAVVIDYKSGKRYGNELKHGEQLQLYTVATLLKFPLLQKVTSELWYLDLDDLQSMTFSRSQGLRFLPNFEKRLDGMTGASAFPPNPNGFSCKWCPYKPVVKGGTGHCAVGV